MAASAAFSRPCSSFIFTAALCSIAAVDVRSRLSSAVAPATAACASRASALSTSRSLGHQNPSMLASILLGHMRLQQAPPYKFACRSALGMHATSCVVEAQLLYPDGLKQLSVLTS